MAEKEPLRGCEQTKSKQIHERMNIVGRSNVEHITEITERARSRWSDYFIGKHLPQTREP